MFVKNNQKECEINVYLFYIANFYAVLCDVYLLNFNVSKYIIVAKELINIHYHNNVIDKYIH